MHNKPEPDTRALQTDRGANPLGGEAQWGALIEQPQLFSTPQTSRTSDDYWTPKWLFDALDLTFDLDVACPPEGPPHTPCRAYYTQADDGLSQPWHGMVWMNPPFSNANPWVHKFMDHRNGIALTVVGKTKWCNALFQTATAMMLLPSNLVFDQGGIFLPTALWAYGDICAQALHDSKISHVR